MAARLAYQCMDLTELADDKAALDTKTLISKALHPKLGRVAAVCVWPEEVGRAKHILHEIDLKGVEVATVVNFPHGTSSAEETLQKIGDAKAAGATEIDFVIDWKRVLDNPASLDWLNAYVKAIVQACKSEPVCRTKVILESGMITDTGLIEKLGKICLENGVDFLKTSTGKAKVGATPQAVVALLSAIKAHGSGGLKVSGGVKTLDDCIIYQQLFIETLGEKELGPKRFRVGASSLYDDLIKRA